MGSSNYREAKLSLALIGCAFGVRIELTTAPAVTFWKFNFQLQNTTLTDETKDKSVSGMPGTRGAVPVPLKAGGRDLTKDILEALEAKESFMTNIEFPNVSQQEIKAALDRLRSRSMIDYETLDSEQVLLTKEGREIAEEGSHEYKVWDVVKSKGKIAIKDLPVRKFHMWNEVR